MAEALVTNPSGDLRPFPAALWEQAKAWSRVTYDKHSAYSMMAAAKWFKERVNPRAAKKGSRSPRPLVASRHEQIQGRQARDRR